LTKSAGIGSFKVIVSKKRQPKTTMLRFCRFSPVVFHLLFFTCCFSPVVFHLLFFTCCFSPVVFHLLFLFTAYIPI